MFRALSKWCRRVFLCGKKSSGRKAATSTTDKRREDDDGQLLQVADSGHVVYGLEKKSGEAAEVKVCDAQIAVSNDERIEVIKLPNSCVVETSVEKNIGDAGVVGAKRSDVVELTKNIELMEIKVEKWSEEMSVLTLENHRLRAALDDSERERVRLTAELTRLNAKIESMVTKLHVAEMEGYWTKNEMTDLKKDQKRLRKALQDMEEERIALEQVLDGGEAELVTSDFG